MGFFASAKPGTTHPLTFASYRPVILQALVAAILCLALTTSHDWVLSMAPACLWDDLGLMSVCSMNTADTLMLPTRLQLYEMGQPRAPHVPALSMRQLWPGSPGLCSGRPMQGGLAMLNCELLTTPCRAILIMKQPMPCRGTPLVCIQLCGAFPDFTLCLPPVGHALGMYKPLK
jgi:hypothetical protein